MGFVFVDGFDHWTALPGNVGSKWDNKWSVVAGDPAVDASYARFVGGNGLRIASDRDGLAKYLPTQMATIYVGFAYKPVLNQYERDVVMCGGANGNQGEWWIIQ